MSLGFWGNLMALATADGTEATTSLVENTDPGTFWLPTQSATGAAAHDVLFYFIYYITAIFFVASIGAMVYAVGPGVKHKSRVRIGNFQLPGSFRTHGVKALIPPAAFILEPTNSGWFLKNVALCRYQ